LRLLERVASLTREERLGGASTIVRARGYTFKHSNLVQSIGFEFLCEKWVKERKPLPLVAILWGHDWYVVKWQSKPLLRCSFRCWYYSLEP
jgi:hypothetical protein